MGYSATADLQDFFDATPARHAAERMAEGGVELLEAEVRKRTPVAHPPPGVGLTQFAGRRGRTPGTLRESWYTTDVDESVTATGTARFGGDVLTDDPIGPLVEWPTRPHLIRPRADRAPASVLETKRPRRMGDDPAARLRFVNGQGRVVYAAEVHHPGTEGSHMMRDGLAETDATWVPRVGEPEVERWAREQLKVVG